MKKSFVKDKIFVDKKSKVCYYASVLKDTTR